MEEVKKNPLLLKAKDIISGDSEYRPVNPFEEEIRSLAKTEDFLALYRGIRTIFERSLANNPERSLIKEGTLLLHKIITTNYAFFGTLNLHSYKFNFILVSLCEYIGYFARTAGGQPFIFLSLCLLQQCSVYPEFANDLNADFDVPARKFMECVNGSYLDCYISFIRDMILKYKVRLELIGFSTLSILANL
eukprot:TRINITY_DN14086_c0_g1_i2.p1 TRINITY_DN14086_c0_g1~~TRINITY_DN14086_c0_g1_i2.p1  ORF type:complete len:191 (-),score=55.42 TRINITY_DN14086_c0_g1_i2:652-1224(-)